MDMIKIKILSIKKKININIPPQTQCGDDGAILSLQITLLRRSGGWDLKNENQPRRNHSLEIDESSLQ